MHGQQNVILRCTVSKTSKIVYKLSRFQTSAAVNFFLFVFVVVLMMVVILNRKIWLISSRNEYLCWTECFLYFTKFANKFYR